MKYLTRTIWLLSLVSLFNDVASEMLYPVLPVFLKSIGFSVLLIGILEGVAEAMAGLSKGYFGKLSDSRGRRLPFVRLGYAISALAKPAIALAHPAWVFLARTADKLGKGFRTGARDALLSDESTHATRGRVFGFHRSMDTLGAVIGPALALVYLHFFPGRYRELFLVAVIPGLFAVLATLFIREKKGEIPLAGKVSFFSFLHFWKQGGLRYRKLVSGLLVFALINSSDLFLLLRSGEAGLDDQQVILAYILYNMAYALLAFPMGLLADRIGLKAIVILGTFLFAIVYAGMAFATGREALFVLFLLYAWSIACLEGTSRAWITVLVDRKDTATAIGTYSAFQSLCTMVASALTGFLWFQFGATVAFMASGAIAFLVAVYLFTLPAPATTEHDR